MANAIDRDKVARNITHREKYVEKFAVPCTILTTNGEIKGIIYRRGGIRIIDELNLENAFIAVTNASIPASKAGEAKEVEFLVLRQDQIVWIVPSEEEKRES